MIDYEIGEKKKIAKWLGIKASYLSNVCAERRRPGAEAAIRLETVSGISCKDWRYLSGTSLEIKIYKAWRKK